MLYADDVNCISPPCQGNGPLAYLSLLPSLIRVRNNTAIINGVLNCKMNRFKTIFVRENLNFDRIQASSGMWKRSAWREKGEKRHVLMSSRQD
jgi:hypothetical protein